MVVLCLYMKVPGEKEGEVSLPTTANTITTVGICVCGQHGIDVCVCVHDVLMCVD